MAKLKVRYFTAKPGAQGPRYFWQPSGTLRALGWLPERLPDDRTPAVPQRETPGKPGFPGV